MISVVKEETLKNVSVQSELPKISITKKEPTKLTTIKVSVEPPTKRLRKNQWLLLPNLQQQSNLKL